MEKKTTEKQKVSVKKQQWKPGNMLYPLPAVLVSLGREGEKLNLITVAWTGTVCTNPPMVYISVRPERYSYSILKETKTFVINLTTEKLLKATDYCGVRSGRDVDKFKETGLTAIPGPVTGCPMVAESPVNCYHKESEVLSCNPATQARDLQLLDAKYRVKAVQPVDMFPHTHHVENVVLLELKNPAEKAED